MAIDRKYPSESYYDLLGVAPTATRGEIRSAYLNLKEAARSSDTTSPGHSQMLDEAYEVLLDQAERAAYDKYLAQRAAPNVAEPPPSEPPPPLHGRPATQPSRRPSRTGGSIFSGGQPKRSVRRRALGLVRRNPAAGVFLWFVVGLFAGGYAMKLVDETMHWSQYWGGDDPNASWKWLAAVGLWIVAGISALQILFIISRWTKSQK